MKFFFIISFFLFSIQINAQQTFKSHKIVTILINGQTSSDNRQLDIEFYKPKSNETNGTFTIFDKYNSFTKILEIKYLKETSIDNEITKWYYIVNNQKYGFNVLKIIVLPKKVLDSKYIFVLEQYERDSDQPLISQTYLCN